MADSSRRHHDDDDDDDDEGDADHGGDCDGDDTDDDCMRLMKVTKILARGFGVRVSN